MTGSTNQFIRFEPTNTLSKMLIIHRKSIMLMHRPQTPQPGFGSITLLQKFTPPFQNPGSAPGEIQLIQVDALCFGYVCKQINDKINCFSCPERGKII